MNSSAMLTILNQIPAESVNPFALIGGDAGKKPEGQVGLFTEFLQSLLGQGEWLQTGDMRLQGQMLPTQPAIQNPIGEFLPDDVWNQMPAELQAALTEAVEQVNGEDTAARQVPQTIAAENAVAAGAAGQAQADSTIATLSAVRQFFLQQQEQAAQEAGAEAPVNIDLAAAPTLESIEQNRQVGQQALAEIQQRLRLLSQRQPETVMASTPVAPAKMMEQPEAAPLSEGDEAAAVVNGAAQSQPVQASEESDAESRQLPNDRFQQNRQQHRMQSLMTDSVTGGDDFALTGEGFMAEQNGKAAVLNNVTPQAAALFRTSLQDQAAQRSLPLASEPTVGFPAISLTGVSDLSVEGGADVRKAFASHAQPQFFTPSDQVMVHIRQALAQGNDTIRVQLHPADLGSVSIKLSMHKDAISKISFQADRAETLEMLQKDTKELQRMLQEAGFKTDADTTEFSFSGGGQSGEFGGRQDGRDQGQFDMAMAGEGGVSSFAVPETESMSVAEALYAFSSRGNVDIRA